MHNASGKKETASGWRAELARLGALVKAEPGRTPPGPPVILGAFLAVWLFGRADLVQALLALLVCAVVAMVLSRSRREADAARAEAQAAQARLRDMEFALRTTSRVTWTLNVLARRIDHPEALETLLGAVPAYEDASSPAPSFIHPEDAAEMRRAHARCLSSGECGPLHLRFVRADGEIRWVRYGLKLTRDEAGVITRVHAVASDFTNFQARGQAVGDMIAQAERDLAQTRPDLERMLRSIDVAMAPSTVTSDVTPAVFGENRGFQQTADRFARILAEYNARRDAFFTALNHLKVARRQSDMLSQVAHHSADAMLILDERGHVEWINAAFTRMSGYTLDELQGRRAGELLTGPLTDTEALKAFRARVEAGETASCEVINYGKDGAPYWVDFRGAGIRSSDGVVRRTIGVQRDVTARKMMEGALEAALEDARHASAAKSEFVANMSHELRTPLNAVIGYAEMLEEELGDSELGEDATAIRDAARKLLALINELLSLAKSVDGDSEHEVEVRSAGAPRILLIDTDAANRDAVVHTAARLGFAAIVAAPTEAEARASEIDPALIVLNLDTPGALDLMADLRGDAPILTVQARANRLAAIQAGAAACLDAPLARDALAAAMARYARKRERRDEAPQAPPMIENASKQAAKALAKKSVKKETQPRRKTRTKS